MNKLGFLLPHLGNSQLAFQLINSANKFLETHIDTDVIAFVSNQLRPKVCPSFAVMNINEAFDFDGVAIATTLHTAEKLARFPGPRKRYFYVWDLEWSRNLGWSFEKLSEIYNNPNLTLIARHDDHAKVIEQCWNRPVHAVVPDCEVSHMVNLNGKN